jgi:hypothetical protein
VAVIALGVSLVRTNVLEVRVAVGGIAVALVVGLAKIVTSRTITGATDGVKCGCSDRARAAEATNGTIDDLTEVVCSRRALAAPEFEAAGMVIVCQSGVPLHVRLESGSTSPAQPTVSAVVLVDRRGRD